VYTYITSATLGRCESRAGSSVSSSARWWASSRWSPNAASSRRSARSGL